MLRHDKECIWSMVIRIFAQTRRGRRSSMRSTIQLVLDCKKSIYIQYAISNRGWMGEGATCKFLLFLSKWGTVFAVVDYYSGWWLTSSWIILRGGKCGYLSSDIKLGGLIIIFKPTCQQFRRQNNINALTGNWQINQESCLHPPHAPILYTPSAGWPDNLRFY